MWSALSCYLPRRAPLTWAVGLALLAGLALPSCAKPQHRGDVADAPARRTLLKNLSEQVILPSYEDFAEKAATLERGLAEHAELHDDATRLQAQALFREAMLAWQRAELFQVGPAAAVSNFNPGSRGLRAEIYAWDQDDPCVVDRGLVRESYQSDDFAKDVYYYGRGLGAIERLLFDDARATACAESDRVVTPEAWQALVDGDLDVRRAKYALRSAEVVSARAQQLVAEYRDEFMPELAKAGAGSRLFARTQEALNSVSNALFYVDVEVRDLKLGGPLGRTIKCIDTACRTEHAWSELSRAAIEANLSALQAAFVGAPPAGERGTALWGFSDLLRSLDAGGTADEIEAAIEAAQRAVRAIGPRFDQAPRDPSAHAAEAFDALQALADVLNTEFLQKLALSPPVRVAGDND